MPRLPMIAGASGQRLTTDVFAGYNHNLKIADGEFYDTKNLTTAEFPMLANRHKRGIMTGVGGHEFQGLRAIIMKEGLYWVETETVGGKSVGVFYANSEKITAAPNKPPFTFQTERETQLVSMGAYICIFPDGKYINTMDLTDFGDMGESFTLDDVTISYQMCHQDGTVYDPTGGHTSKQSTAPAEPQNGDIWIDTSEGAVKTWSSYTEVWTVIETVYTRVQFSTMGEIPKHFKENDGVRISGLAFDDLNGSKILYAVGGEANTQNDYIVLVGIQEINHAESGDVTIERKVPKMDFVCEAQNRLWGCRYGNDGNGNLNELYCCALGDFKNWEQYLGVSTDSWRASCGSDGAWTGCINYLGSPTFFKENRIHPISVSSVGAHQVGDLPARGVQEGSHRSLAIVNETLYYKTRSGVAAWQGGIPVDVGAALGDVRYYEASAGVFGQRYHISMRDEQNAWNLFVLDVKNGVWMREDELHAEGWTSWGDELYAKAGNSIVTINGTEGQPENKVEWYAETGVQYYELPDHKYVSRYNLRLKMEKGARVRLYIEYDSSGKWEPSGEVRVLRLDSFVLPVRPRRCDHMRLKIVGEGEVRIFSIARVLERGSDL